LARAAGPFDNLLTAVPPQTNTLVLVNVKAAYASPLAKAEKWADSYYQKYKSGTGFVPPDAEAMVIASTVNLSALTRDHQIGLIKVSSLPAIKGLAARESGTISVMGDQSFVLSPRDVYFTTLTGQAAIAAIYPADRQATARWARYALNSKTNELVPYLKLAAEAAGDDTFTLAVDLTDSQDATLLKLGLSMSPTVVKHKVMDIERLARFVASTRGLTFSARVTDTITGTVRVDFGIETIAHKPVLRDLFLELLEDQGVAITGMDKWDVQFGPTSMTLSGPLTTADLRRVMSLFAFPGATSEHDAKLSPDQVTGAATERYWAAVNAILTDIRSKKDSPDYTKMATWHEKAAAQLDHLNRQGVDPIAVDVAHELSRRFQAIALSLRGAKLDAGAVSQKAYWISQPQGYYGSPYWGGWWNIRAAALTPQYLQSNIPQVQGEIAQIAANNEKQRLLVWNQIDQMISDARNKLLDKYKSGF
jgi:hypothetical protein